MTGYTTQKFPKTRIATLDVCAIGLRKHHVAAMVELDVQESNHKKKPRFCSEARCIVIGSIVNPGSIRASKSVFRQRQSIRSSKRPFLRRLFHQPTQVFP